MAEGAPRAPAREARGRGSAAPGERARRRVSAGLAIAPYACAAANLVAAIALATVLAPGTPLGGSLEARASYVSANADAWRIGWALWIVAAITLLWLFAWWAARLPTRGLARVALAVAAVGIAGDVLAELMLIVRGPIDYASIADQSFAITGAYANGLYTLAGALLTLLSPFRGPFRAWSWAIWAGGALIAVGSVAAMPLVTVAASAVVFILFPPWCVALTRALR